MPSNLLEYCHDASAIIGSSSRNLMGSRVRSPAFAGTTPGQSVASILTQLTCGDLVNLIEPQTAGLLANAGEALERDVLIRACEHALRSEPERIAEPATLRLVLRNLAADKAEELDYRLKAKGLARKDLHHSAGIRVLQGFLGLASDEQVSQRENFHSAIAADVTFGLFPHQRSVVRRTHAVIGRGEGRTLVHMPTGAGKTRTAMHYVAQVLNADEPCVVMWLASGRELLEQAADAFATAWSSLGNREVTVHRFWGDHGAAPDTVRDGIIVAGFAKMHAWMRRNALEAARLGARTHLVVVDEAHQAIATTYRAVIEGLADVGQTNAVLGLTATPGRTWNDVGADTELAAFFENTKVVLEIDGYADPVAYLLDEGYLARPRFERIVYGDNGAGGTSMPNPVSEDYDADTLADLATSHARNRAILDAVAGLIVRNHRRIILFAASVAHARCLSTVLEVNGTCAPMVTGETPDEVRTAILREYKGRSSAPIVLCNFGVLTTGIDAPATSAAVIARPTRSLVLFSQMVGRATRGPRAGGNAESEILTVHDPSCPGFGDVAEAFFNWEDIWSE